ncbi:Dienelactone hydrolase family protein [Streptomyces sp. YIM 130001]|uniref:dienelactone hydrolase family protein n=1 Tax=Streptomyces sp. YIM 130001 TaxID=2259644 RepID=UPI000E648801|nr:dienelactone hydrolase family protein [Streptomyces sp. YIM 130001]RII11688.1 Dienelactone hydrolase family protein [Streptomyces sp. YIM 130001]
MSSRTLQIPMPDGRADALAAFPDDGERHPAVLMYPDAFGLRPVLREMAEQLAGHGYFVLVPHYLYRNGRTPLVDLPEFIGDEERDRLVGRLMPLLGEHTLDRVLDDAAAYLRFLGERPEAAPGPVAVTGYCFGGLLAVRTAAAHPGEVAAVAAFHAPVAADGPDRLGQLAAEVHFGHAAGDITAEDLSSLNQVLDGAGLTYTSEIYPDTVHGFTMSDTSAHSPSALDRHWERLLPLLARNLRTT